MRHLKKFNEGILTSIFVGLLSIKILVELLSFLAHFLRKYNMSHSDGVDNFSLFYDRDIHKGKFNINVTDKNMTIDNEKSAAVHFFYLDIDLNSKKLFIRIKKGGLLSIKDDFSYILSNADIYNICYILRKNGLNIDYNSRENVFTR